MRIIINISWTNHIEGNLVLNPKTLGKIFSQWFKKFSNGYILPIWYKLVHFSLPLSAAIHRMRNTPTTLCPTLDVKRETNFILILYFTANYPKPL